jgi:L-rhamnonate dehydratase
MPRRRGDRVGRLAGGEAGVRITGVEAIVLRQPDLDDRISDGSQDDLVVRVTTDEGLTGIGEVDSAPEVVKAIVEAPSSHAVARSLRELLVGEDPRDVERLWDVMYRGTIYFGRRGAALHAISGVDIALWDIRGQAEGEPIHRLLGQTRRPRVRAYASRLMPDTEAETEAAVAGLRAQGFTAVKLGWGPLGRDPRHDDPLAAAARRAAGDSMDVMIDAGLGYGADPVVAAGVAREFERLGIHWLEEPFEPDEYEAYAQLADSVDIPVAAGEQDATRWGFRELIERGHVDVVQPDVTRCGGITETLRIARLARDLGRRCVPHAWKSGIVKAASLHVNAVLEGDVLQEYCVAGTPINSSLVTPHFELDAEGFVAVPTAPGLGVVLDESIVRRYRV